VTVTPNSMAHGQQLLDAMLLLGPSRNLLKEIIVKVVDPYLINMKQKLKKKKKYQKKFHLPFFKSHVKTGIRRIHLSYFCYNAIW
jgi:hypothetical protein